MSRHTKRNHVQSDQPGLETVLQEDPLFLFRPFNIGLQYPHLNVCAVRDGAEEVQ